MRSERAGYCIATGQVGFAKERDVLSGRGAEMPGGAGAPSHIPDREPELLQQQRSYRCVSLNQFITAGGGINENRLLIRNS